MCDCVLRASGAATTGNTAHHSRPSTICKPKWPCPIHFAELPRVVRTLTLPFHSPPPEGLLLRKEHVTLHSRKWHISLSPSRSFISWSTIWGPLAAPIQATLSSTVPVGDLNPRQQVAPCLWVTIAGFELGRPALFLVSLA